MTPRWFDLSVFAVGALATVALVLSSLLAGAS